MNAKVDTYLAGATRWRAESKRLRAILLDCDLDEALKWNKPCYSSGGENILILQSMKNFLAVLFFKGALLDDPAGLLEEQGPNTRSARRICFTSAKQVEELEHVVRALVRDAIRVERAGLSVPKSAQLVLVEELQARLNRNAKLKAAFEGLTPGRQREYNLHISSAKQSKTRESRVDKYLPKILAGKGLRDR